jgi:hypothetical protein
VTSLALRGITLDVMRGITAIVMHFSVSYWAIVRTSLEAEDDQSLQYKTTTTITNGWCGHEVKHARSYSLAGRMNCSVASTTHIK